MLCGAGTVSTPANTARERKGIPVPDQFQKTNQPKQQPTNPADTSGNAPDAATPESVEVNTTAATEAQVTEAQAIANDPVVAAGGEEGGEQQQGAGDNYDDDEAWPYRQLQQEAKNRDLDASGKREEIVSRLREHDAGGSGSSPDSGTENGVVQRSERAPQHADILQADSDERRRQQLAAVQGTTDAGDSTDS